MLTLQEVFDKSVGGVIAQGGPSMDAVGACVYRTADGLKCAAGHLIEDAHYKIDLEGCGVANDRTRGALKASGVPNHPIVEELQAAHDKNVDEECFLTAFAKRAIEIAAEYNLDPSAVQIAD